MKETNFSVKRFAGLMKAKGFNDGKLAYATGVSKTMIFYMRKGERTKVGADVLAAVAKPLQTSVQYLMEQTDDPSPIQPTMSPVVADIVDLIDKLPPSKQRELRELANALRRIDSETDVEVIYGEIMERITKLAEVDGGEAALKRLTKHLRSASGSSGSSMSNSSDGESAPDDSESTEKPLQSND